MKILIKTGLQYIAIFFNLPPTSSHLHPLQVRNCDSILRLVVDEDDNGKFRLERFNAIIVMSRHSFMFKVLSVEYIYIGLRIKPERYTAIHWVIIILDSTISFTLHDIN